MEDGWIKVKDEVPPHREVVWGYFKNRDVELVHDALTDREYQEDAKRYLDDGNWYSLESEKTGCVHYWYPLKRPKRPKIEE